MSDDIVAFCFNLYESDNNCQFDVQLVGCSQFDSEEDDWACSAIFTTGENLFSFEASDWENALESFSQVLIKIIECATFKDAFGNKHIAFVVYRSKRRSCIIPHYKSLNKRPENLKTYIKIPFKKSI